MTILLLSIIFYYCCVTDDVCVTAQLSYLLLRMMEFLSGPHCHAWVNQYVWLHVTKHYVTFLKELCNDKVCHDTILSLLVIIFTIVTGFFLAELYQSSPCYKLELPKKNLTKPRKLLNPELSNET